MAATLQDVARLAGVSVKTVSNVVNNYTHVRATTRTRVQGAIIEQGVAFDAVFGLNDTLALGAMRVLQEAQLKIPDDVSVFGFDDLDETKYSLPTLSTVGPGRTEIAETAVRVLMGWIAGRAAPEQPSPDEYLADFTLRERESTH